MQIYLKSSRSRRARTAPYLSALQGSSPTVLILLRTLVSLKGTSLLIGREKINSASPELSRAITGDEMQEKRKKNFRKCFCSRQCGAPTENKKEHYLFVFVPVAY